MKKVKKSKSIVAKNSREISEALGIHSKVDQMLIEQKAQISSLTVKAIENSKMSINEIVERSGIARSKVSAIRNGALSGISLDLFFRVMLATGVRVKVRAA